MSDWVRFQEEITEGAKRELPRATRFIYMELSRKARRTQGVIRLRTDMPLEGAVWDLIGGDRREIREALPLLLSEKHAMLAWNEANGELAIPSWSKWNGSDLSTERVRAHRSKSRSTENPSIRSPDETEVKRDETVSCVSPRNSETEPEERRGEERRSDPPVVPLAGDAPPESVKGRRKSARPLPEDFAPSPENQAYALANGLDVAHELAQFRAHAESEDRRQASWQAAFRLWLGRSVKHGQRSRSGVFQSPAHYVSPRPPPPKPLEGSSPPPASIRDLFAPRAAAVGENDA